MAPERPIRVAWLPEARGRKRKSLQWGTGAGWRHLIAIFEFTEVARSTQRRCRRPHHFALQLVALTRRPALLRSSESS